MVNKNGVCNFDFWIKVAETKGWKYIGTESVNNNSALLFSFGHSQLIVYKIEGYYKELPLSIFNAEYVTGQGDYISEHTFPVFSFELPMNIPHFYLNRTDNSVNFFSNVKYKVSLPKAFENKFSLFAPKEYELEALQVFTPDILHHLLSIDWNYDVELVNNRVFVIRNNQLKSIEQLDKELLTAYEFVKKIENNTSSMKFTPIRETPYLLNKIHFLNRGANPLKSGNIAYILSLIYATLIALILFSAFYKIFF
ncbi:MAG: hypothetical protein RLZZ230_793 [Candidatus Parcubacteria bacterium]|jgi:hypothetical protein